NKGGQFTLRIQAVLTFTKISLWHRGPTRTPVSRRPARCLSTIVTLDQRRGQELLYAPAWAPDALISRPVTRCAREAKLIGIYGGFNSSELIPHRQRLEATHEIGARVLGLAGKLDRLQPWQQLVVERFDLHARQMHAEADVDAVAEGDMLG